MILSTPVLSSYYEVARGAFSTVLAAKDNQATSDQRKLVALKKIDMVSEYKLLAKSRLRELKLGRILNH